MEDGNITSDALSGDAQLTASDAIEAVASVDQSSDSQMTLAEINQALGKQFKDKDSALKAFKDTFSYVGKKKEDIEKEVLAKVSENNQVEVLANELKEMRVERFFDRNPDLAPYRSAYEKVGGNPEEFFNSDAIKPIIEKAKGYDESQKLRTVLESNPRIASSKDSLSKARELQRSEGHSDKVEDLAVKAVLDVYDK